MEPIEPYKDLSKILKEENILIDKNMIETQKTLIHFGTLILDKLNNLPHDQISTNLNINKYDMDAPIRKYLQTFNIPKGYGGNGEK